MCSKTSIVVTLVLAVIGLGAWIAASPAAWGQDPWELLYTFDGEAEGDDFGESVSGAGDVNNDGHDDLIVGARTYGDVGRAYVYCGETGALLWTFDGEATWDYFGHSVSGAGDVNDDGYDDLIVGAWANDAGVSNAGRAYVYSGQTGALLWTFAGEAEDDELGYSVSGAGDVDNDGYDDLVVGAPYNDAGGSYAGRAYVYSGQTGALLWTFTGEAEDDELGCSVSGAGDVNNDGYADLIAGAREHGDVGRAYVYSGQTGVLLWTFDGEAAGDRFGTSVSGAGDVNNDGYDDLIVGASGNDAGGNIAGRAYVYSGQTGVLLWTFTGEAAYDQFGNSVSGLGDVNNDCYDDLIVAAHYHSFVGEADGRVYVYSGQTGTLLCVFDAEAEDDEFGESVSGAGDVNNDGFNELIVGAPGHDDAGKAYVLSCREGEPFVRGDANGDMIIDLADAVYLLNYLFKGGEEPVPLEAGDASCDGLVDLADVVYLLNYLFKGGDPPSC